MALSQKEYQRVKQMLRRSFEEEMVAAAERVRATDCEVYPENSSCRKDILDFWSVRGIQYAANRFS